MVYKILTKIILNIFNNHYRSTLKFCIGFINNDRIFGIDFSLCEFSGNFALREICRLTEEVIVSYSALTRSHST